MSYMPQSFLLHALHHILIQHEDDDEDEDKEDHEDEDVP